MMLGKFKHMILWNLQIHLSKLKTHILCTNCIIRQERKHYYLHRDLGQRQRRECLSVIIDGMDQSKTNLPHLTRERKCGCNLWRLRLVMYFFSGACWSLFYFNIQNPCHGSYCPWSRNLCLHRCSLLAPWLKFNYQHSVGHPPEAGLSSTSALHPAWQHSQGEQKPVHPLIPVVLGGNANLPRGIPYYVHLPLFAMKFW